MMFTAREEDPGSKQMPLSAYLGCNPLSIRTHPGLRWLLPAIRDRSSLEWGENSGSQAILSLAQVDKGIYGGTLAFSATSHSEPETKPHLLACALSPSPHLEPRPLQHSKNFNGSFIGDWGQLCTLLIIGPTPNASHPALYPFTHLHSHAALHSNYNLNPPTPSLLLTSILYPTRFSRSSQSTPFFSIVPWLKPGMSTEVLLRLQVTTPHLSRRVSPFLLTLLNTNIYHLCSWTATQ